MHALLLAMTLIGQTAEAKPVLRPVGAGQFYVEPDAEAVLRWEVGSGRLAGPVDVVVRDLAGKEEAKVRTRPAGTRGVEASVRVARGYHEVSVPATGQRFGLLALPAWKGTYDPFFAIDGALSWLVREDALRSGLIAACARSGIGMVRERLTSGAVHPNAERWEWQTAQRFDTLRQDYRSRGVGVLEMAHDAPVWMKRVERYPDDLPAFASLWNGVAGHWRPVWGAVEVWNEPDIDFGGDLPADQYVPLAKTLAYGFRSAGVDVPLVGGATAHFKPPWMETAGRNGLLDVVDAFSFHTYGTAAQMEPLVGEFRGWLRRNGKGSMPLWITECGRPWDRGPDRPPVAQDARSALDITMKAVEARACGVARYFAFVLPFYDENNNNFGMTDRRATPLLSFAAYAQCARVLAGRDYLGDLRIDEKGVTRARVFGHAGGAEAVAVLYTGKVDPGAKVRPDLTVLRCEGIDGRPLKVESDGTVPVPDGLVYVWIGRSTSTPRIDTATTARWLHADRALVKRGEPSPLVLRYQFDPARVAATPEGYRLKGVPAATMPIQVRVFNLGTTPRTVRLAAEVENTSARPKAVEALAVPPRSSALATFTVPTTGLFDSADRVAVTVEAREGDVRLDRLSISLIGEPDLTRVLRRHPSARNLPVRESSRWTPNNSPGTVTMEADPSTFWRLKVRYNTGGDHWAYPYFRLPDDVRLTRDSTLLIRARCSGPASTRLFLWEGDSGVGYITPDSIVAADGRWHVARVRVADLILSSANAADPDGKLDASAVRRLSLGMNARGPEATFDVSDIHVVEGEAR